ncbi:Putative phage protein [Gluconobacter oxydans 621H]|uniref:Phage head-tail adapter protein n=3 Tax=Gluconobacter TaxID=441 RepID=A0A149TMC3_9PROT|nr:MULTISPECIES: gpW family head-tail joining protein [Gluconobacter]AAW62070.1 Putative phage protein [Gluconobacter oxydans 621H]KXV50225.1 phage head-tail adapter protein [Gluconobacter albidus]KXV65638.1 phage head-tail adapter protein [Gluconobacter oxydans]
MTSLTGRGQYVRRPPQTSMSGLTTAQLQANLAAAQQAYNDLMIGGKPVAVSYSQVNGSRSVTYTAANKTDLLQYIQLLQKQLGISRRRPVRFVFR